MVEQVAHRKLVGNACLYRELATRPRSFLRRNLNYILDKHEQDLLNTRAVDAAEQNGEMIANEVRTAGWDYPTKEMLDDLMKGQRPVLKLDALHLRRHDATKSTGSVH